MPAPEPVRVFISYRHADHRVLEELRDHLGWLQNNEQIAVFVDRDLDAGDDWDARIKAELERAEIILLVITASFMRSSYCTKIELTRALERQAGHGARLISVIAASCDWEAMSIFRTAALPKDTAYNLKPLNKWRSDCDVALTQIAQHVRRTVDKLAATRPPAALIDLTHYRRRAQERWSAVDLTLLVQPGRDNPDAAPIRLQDVFIPQACRRSRPPQVLPRDYRERHAKPEEPEPDLDRHWQASPREPVLDLLAGPEVRRLVLLGDPGAGKSALARYLLLALLDETPSADAAWLYALRPRTPFLIELRDYVAREAAGECRDLLELPRLAGQPQNLGFDAAAVRGTIGRAPALLILDGLDEIFDRDRRERLIHEIVGLANQPELRVLVSSRVAGFKEHRFKAADFLTATLDDLDDGQIQAFAQGWFRLAWQNDPARAAAKRAELLQTLKDRPPLRPLAGNPLLLTVMALVLRHQSLARTRIGLYDQCVRLLCHHWDFEQHLHAAKHPLVRGLDASDKETLLRHVALAMQTTPNGLRANAIAAETLEQVLADYFASAWSAEPAEAKTAARELAELLQTRNWMLCPRGPGLFGFVHRTFLEYLVARALLMHVRAHEISLDQLIAEYAVPNGGDENWYEIIPLLAALLADEGPALTRKLVNGLISAPGTMRTHIALLSLGFLCMAEVDPRRLPMLKDAADALFRELKDWLDHVAALELGIAEEDSLSDIAASLGLVGLNWPGRKILVDDEFVALFGEVNKEHEQLSFVLEEMFARVFRDLPVTRNNAVAHSDPRVRAFLLSSLAWAPAEDIDILEFVYDRAVKDPHPEPRRAALSGLAHVHAQNQKILEFVSYRAITEFRPRSSA